MAQVSKKQQHKANVAAMLAVVFVAMFALSFIGLVIMLNDMADKLDHEEQVTVGTEAPTDPFYVLLIGSDSRKGTALYTGKANEHAQVDQHSDVMTLMRIDPATYKITLVTIPRDTVLNGETNKINDSLSENDPERVVESIRKLTGADVNHYMLTTFISFENLINALGGVDVDVPKTIVVPDPATGKNVTVKAGKNKHLNGSQALVLARARKEYGDNGDIIRQANVRAIERSLINKMLDAKGNFDVYHVLSALEDDTKTSLDLSSMGLLMMEFVEHADEVKIYDCTGPYWGETRESDGLWVVPEDASTWSTLMAAVDAGEDPSGIVEMPKS
ncbi:MAG: LCP family protein [Eggerthellaceae bacterium]|nr:LCP family protein [Eggerthellaceae bacterium]